MAEVVSITGLALVQVMHSASHVQTSYQSGDRNGLLYQRDRGAV